MTSKSIKTIFACCLMGCAASTALTSCEDMLEMDSDRQVFEPDLDSKTDSIFYIIGTLKGVQQAIDQYVLVNEMRGDLLAPTQYADSALTQLYNYTATTANKYDSAYVYYRVINNCNYYVAHRDTTLRTGSRQVALQEYAEALAIRAWSYMQLAKTYGRVPFYTEPLDNVSQGDAITANTDNYHDLRGICDELAPELQKFVGTAVPNYGNIDAYDGKMVVSQRIMFPVDLVLADLYLETGRYEEAARLYFDYLLQQRLVSRNRYVTYNVRTDRESASSEWYESLPGELLVASTEVYYRPTADYANYDWGDFMTGNPLNLPYGEVITYVPMAVNKLQGTISNLPALMGYDQFAANNGEPIDVMEEIALTPSDEYLRLSDSQLYYYLVTLAGNDARADTLGDFRRWASIRRRFQNPTKNIDQYYYGKWDYGNVVIYRTSVIYLRLAECLNRMGFPDAAFAVLKDGLGNVANTTATTRQTLADSTTVSNSYITPESYKLLTTTLPFLTQATRNILGAAVGIHSHGSGYTAGVNSLYQYQTVVNQKAQEMNRRYGLTLPDSVEVYTEAGKQQAIEIVEDLLCDEYALEAAWEGHRFGDLCRMARHKNESSVFGSGWGGRWLNGKLAFKQTGIDFSNESNWYLPFK